MIKFFKDIFSNNNGNSENKSKTISSVEFKGSGFHYKLISGGFVFTIGIQPSRYGENRSTEFGIQPIEFAEDVKKSNITIVNLEQDF